MKKAILSMMLILIFGTTTFLFANTTLKTITIEPKDKKDLQAYESWVVRWQSRHGKYSNDTKPEAEVFTNKPDAKSFANELKKAFKIIKHTYGTRVDIEKSNYNRIP